ncbi:hypothetical protein [uncultured Ruegeria sp.]|uniref:hypothetical protein n=1 Tax=uncultured Ruegeria sp. TaxID=259304 RepID=UPI0026218E63|nr:hypothetical protein [uncultured Ruegeria sp.]
MRFKMWPRFAFEDTPRKRSALRRKQQKECEAFPLLADQIAEQQPSEDEVMFKRAVDWERQEKRSRKQRADKWREARCRIVAYSSNEAAALRHAWNCAPYPADPVYLLDFLHGYSIGRFTLDTLPFDLIPSDPHGVRKHQPEISVPKGPIT